MNNKRHLVPPAVTETILESISDGVFTVDHDWRITSFNRAAEQITGVPRKEAVGRFCWEVFRSNMCEGDCALSRTMEEEKSFVASSTTIITSEKKEIPISVSTSLLKSENGEILGGVETFRDHSIVEELRREISGSFSFGNIVSRSKVMQDLFGILERVALSDSTVLIEGETGTGKELLARAIHSFSNRKGAPFISINCGALPDALLESELFGYRAGAFTDARTDKPGLFAAAEQGTILLDEIGDTSSAFQIKLLRVLQEHAFKPLGSTETIKTSARIITATNRDIKEMVAQKEFRQDLYYRINIMTLTLPPLRKRPEDIPLLIDHFIAKTNAIKSRSIAGMAPPALSLLLDHDYPGNIRELENIIEHAFVLCNNSMITIDHLPRYLLHDSPPTPPVEKKIPTLQTAEKEIIIKTLEQFNYNRTTTAAHLGMHKSTLFRKIKSLCIMLPEQDGRHRRS